MLFGGWGFIVADQGSGARLGHALLQECLLVSDGIRPGSDLTSDVLSEFGHEPSRLVAFARYATPGDFGRYSPKIFAAAQFQRPDRPQAPGGRRRRDRRDAGCGGSRRRRDDLLCSAACRRSIRHGCPKPTRARLVEARADALSGAVSPRGRPLRPRRWRMTDVASFLSARRPAGGGTGPALSQAAAGARRRDPVGPAQRAATRCRRSATWPNMPPSAA